jgi:hypothetical protein
MGLATLFGTVPCKRWQSVWRRGKRRYLKMLLGLSPWLARIWS